MDSQKHPLGIRWVHWVNFPLICIMVWSGLCIYWANAVYILPRSWLKIAGLEYSLGKGLAWHWAFAVVFVANGILYFVFLLVSGHWRYVIPKVSDFRGALLVAAHDLHLIKTAPPVDGKYNSAQKLAYFSVSILGVLLVVTGFAIYKPTQLNWMLELLGGYESARFIHFYATVAIVLFFFVHIAQVVRAGWNNFRAMITGFEKARKNDRRAFLTASVAGAGGLIGWFLLGNSRTERGTPAILRKVNDNYAAFWKSNFSLKSKSPPVDADGRPVRINGDIGMIKTVDTSNYSLTVEDPKTKGTFQVSLEEIRNMPQTTESFEFKCIEGWSRPVSCKGVRFSEFMNQTGVNGNYEYVGMSSIDKGYYVSWDFISLMHPQTLLCYEMNGVPLAPENGAPLRILSSVKYGVKQIKQLGSVAFLNERPNDYWAERGYDDYLGL
jgi:thiosulfate reductase cytochrome b subunit